MSDDSSPLFITTQAILDAVEALMRREVPATQRELTKLVADIKDDQEQQRAEWERLANWVQTQVQPLAQLNEAKLAERLAAPLSRHLPTPAGLEQAGKQAAQQIEAAFAAGTRQSTQQAVTGVQAAIRQLTAAAEAAITALLKAIERIPQSIPIDLLRSWGALAGVFFTGSVVATLLYASAGWFTGVSAAKYARVLDEGRAAQEERDFYRQKIATFRQEMGTVKTGKAKANLDMTNSYFPPYKPRNPEE